MLSAITMDDGSAIILSTAKYYSPEGKSIQDNGVVPEEIVVDQEPAGADVDDDQAADAKPEVKSTETSS